MCGWGHKSRSHFGPALEILSTLSLYTSVDVDLAEHIYNPFAFDVSDLDNLYRVYFSVSSDNHVLTNRPGRRE
ncbi:hypothetical protein BC628DRAFT_1394010 [Trametes gibbosa]|nr:hypothetical protein BC628DRAFT_1394010 [Trametes gibbosa]